MSSGNTTLRVLLLVAGSALLAPGQGRAARPQERTLFYFSGDYGEFPYNGDGLIADASGNLYGTASRGGTNDYGVVFEFRPPAEPGGPWTETVLYSFQNGADGCEPSGGLRFDSEGNLYGTTGYGGPQGAGAVFELSPPSLAGGAWTETTLHTFQNGSDGAVPVPGVVLDSSGNLYGTTYYGGSANVGVVFELSPPTVGGGVWTETILHTFTGSPGNYPGGANPDGGLLRSDQGALIGTTVSGGQSNECGLVFELGPPNDRNDWSEKVLYSFKGSNDGCGPFGDMAQGPGGVLYGVATAGGAMDDGTVYRLLPPAVPGEGWAKTTLYEFTGGADQEFPLSIVLHGRTLYGTTGGTGTSQDGTIFELTQVNGTWSLTTLHTFDNSDGQYPLARPLPMGEALYGTTLDGGYDDTGVLFAIIP
jgi:uncharacterized repeat protein (TIGR03803 family)